MKLDSRLSRYFALPSAALLLFLLAHCGNIGDPLPPLVQIPTKVSDLQALQVGNTVRLSWSLSKANTDGSAPPSLKGIEIFRLPVEGLFQNASGKTVFPESVEPWRVLRQTELENFKPGEKLTLVDPLAGVPLKSIAQTTLGYALKAFNNKGQDAGYSNVVVIKLFSPPEPPHNLKSVLSEKAIETLWEEPASNLDGSAVDTPLRFVVYRSDDPKVAPGVRLTSSPTNGNSFKDETMELGKTYYYSIRTVASPNAGGIESLDSERLEVTNLDVYPPRPPSEITAISNGENISLVWPANPEPDLAGYLVYRAGPEKKFEKLTNQPITMASWVDTAVAKGQVYFYKIQAVDQKGNVSNFSEEISEKVE
ncbi:MAG: hypothetical protein U0V70_14150 [Terriglobia bacterium]